MRSNRKRNRRTHYAPQVREKLLGFGGRTVRLKKPFYPDKLLKAGSIQVGPVLWCLGKPQQCHANAAELWIRNQGALQLCTGYALCEGVWVSHSWCSSKSADAPHLFETKPIEWEAYFGFVLGEVDAVDFAFRYYMVDLTPEQTSKSFYCSRSSYHWYMSLLEHLFPERVKDE